MEGRLVIFVLPFHLWSGTAVNCPVDVSTGVEERCENCMEYFLLFGREVIRLNWDFFLCWDLVLLAVFSTLTLCQSCWQPLGCENCGKSGQGSCDFCGSVSLKQVLSCWEEQWLGVCTWSLALNGGTWSSEEIQGFAGYEASMSGLLVGNYGLCCLCYVIWGIYGW